MYVYTGVLYVFSTHVQLLEETWKYPIPWGWS